MVIGKQKGMDLTFLTIMAIMDTGYFHFKFTEEKMERITNRIDVIDSKGNPQQITEYTDFIDTSTRAGRSEKAGSRRHVIKTDVSELNVHPIDDHTFKVVNTGEILRKV